MVYTKTIKIQIDSGSVALDISDKVADYIDQALRDYFEDMGYLEETIDDIVTDNDFWNNVIKDLIPRLTA